jgi:hypothetical protein
MKLPAVILSLEAQLELARKIQARFPDAALTKLGCREVWAVRGLSLCEATDVDFCMTTKPISGELVVSAVPYIQLDPKDPDCRVYLCNSGLAERGLENFKKAHPEAYTLLVQSCTR